MKKVVLINDTRLEMHHGCSRVMNNIDYLIKKYGGVVTAYWPVGKDWRSSEDIKREILFADIVIVNGEGSIHHDSKTGTPLLHLAKYCQQYNVPCYLINALFQDMSPEYGKLLKYFSLVSVRDSFSYKQIEQLGVVARVVPDLTFYSESLNNQNRQYDIGFTCSMSPEKTVMINKQFKASYKCAVYLPIVYQKNIWQDDAEIESSREKLKRLGLFMFIKKGVHRLLIQPYLKGIPKYSVFKCHNEYFEYISNLKGLVTGRFHAACFAINSYTPFCVYSSNSHKVEALIKDVGLDTKRILSDGEMALPESFADKELANINKYICSAKTSTELLFQEMFSGE